MECSRRSGATSAEKQGESGKGQCAQMSRWERGGVDGMEVVEKAVKDV